MKHLSSSDFQIEFLIVVVNELKKYVVLILYERVKIDTNKNIET